MKTKVTLNEVLVKMYYNQVFLRGGIWISGGSLVIGTVAAMLYIFYQHQVWQGIALEVIALFIAAVVFIMNRNQRKVALETLKLSERDYYFEFGDESMKVTIHRDENEFSYTELNIKRLRNLFRIQRKVGKTNKIYIIPVQNFTMEEWGQIVNRIEYARKRAKQNPKM